MAPAADAGTITLGDLTVNRMGYGAMRITGPGIWGDPPDPEASKGVLRRTLELGVNFIDTASAYEASERLIGEALAPYSDGVVVTSKAGLYRTGPGEWPIDSSPEALRRQTEQSLAPCASNGSTCISCTAPIPRSPSRSRSAPSRSCRTRGRSVTSAFRT